MEIVRTIITYGTFDLLYVSHVNLLKLATKIGDYLIVGLSTDYFNILEYKKFFYSNDN
ncbi:adenylyltransferase/cytidyltransferase family protein [Oceanobacillus sp. FSL K6-3682]|uniref:adenylyltransferase/cytidyltransferase family protein n=1 Tax=Oceanobacillus sp. FSL K6-3682 TaxID=2921503 RepID=UPI0030D7C5DD